MWNSSSSKIAIADGTRQLDSEMIIMPRVFLHKDWHCCKATKSFAVLPYFSPHGVDWTHKATRNSMLHQDVVCNHAIYTLNTITQISRARISLFFLQLGNHILEQFVNFSKSDVIQLCIMQQTLRKQWVSSPFNSAKIGTQIYLLKRYSNIIKDKQFSRHVRYCRAKVRDGMSPRRKSCNACIKAKTGCDLSLPSCSQCVNKNRQCLYQFLHAPSTEGDAVGVLGPRLDVALNHIDLRASNGNLVGRNPARREHFGNSANDLHHLFAGDSFYHNLSSNTWPSIQLDSGTSNVDGTISADGRLDLISPPSLLWSLPSEIFFQPQFNRFKDRVVLGSVHVISLLPSFVHLDTKTIIEKRGSNLGLHGSPLGRIYCMSILKSFPGMLCANNGALPPFIHPKARASVVGQTDLEDIEKLPEPLAICSSIVRMYLARSPGNLAFIWRTIQSESVRIEDEVGAMFFIASDHGLKFIVPILRCLEHPCFYSGHDHISHPRSPRR
jgi:hypothetical protein